MAKKKKADLKRVLPSLVFAILGLIVLGVVIINIRNPIQLDSQASGYQTLTPGTDTVSLKRDLTTMDKSMEIYEELTE